jgi:hypothetical protein
MKCIKVKAFVAPVGKEYDATAYPGLGAFFSEASNTLFFVGYAAGSTVPHVAPVAIGTASKLLWELPGPTPGLELVATPNPGFSEDFILKALAIAQSPQLAVSLLIKPA